jgi:hypothetical protein
VVHRETARLEKVKESGLEVNGEGTKYTFIFREQNGGQHHDTKLTNEFFDNEAKLKYFEVALTEFHAGRN